ncbi:hypothetical protein YC2023_080919 [Brassica napus]
MMTNGRRMKIFSTFFFLNSLRGQNEGQELDKEGLVLLSSRCNFLNSVKGLLHSRGQLLQYFPSNQMFKLMRKNKEIEASHMED